ncbi:MAG: MBOAT family protein [Clostridia bacterium]|nr:MBOAT family protein [Clostridia bacterium]
MVFSSYEFVFAFLPIVLVGYFCAHKSMLVQNIILVVASLFFYAYFNISYLPIILASIVINYLIGYFISKTFDKKWLSKSLCATGVLFNLGLLGYFKYYDFFVENINSVFGTDFVLKNILLPLGISFFTFQQLSFIISVYKKEEKVEDFLTYSLFVSFFPQLVAGPIVSYSEMMPQFLNKKNRRFNFENFCPGLYIFVFGLFKKLVIADTLNIFVNNGFSSDELSFAAGWVTSLSYTLQIYFDFSGYSDMAIGLGKMFNIDIPLNFNSPYKSQSIGEFWQRWHITLGRALRTFIYIPLGGNRKGKIRMYLNYMITFLLSGLWHGASWTFVLWGGLNGLCIVFEKIFSKLLAKIPKPIKIAVTFLITNALWVLFRAESFDRALAVYKAMVNVSNLGISAVADIAADGIMGLPAPIALAYVFILIVGLLVTVFFSKNVIERAEKFKLTTLNSVIVAVLFAVSVLFISRESVFIYFNF